MPDFRRVTDQISVSPQIAPDDVARAAAQGFRTIINNRPDGEAPDQPSGHQIEQAAREAGLAYFHIPVRGGPTPEQVETTERVVSEADKPVLAFCRSGNRSILTWALAETHAGARDRQELIALGRQAGYDLSAALGG
ncbi:MAG TPA: TIGR01244 family sulfur transferase [Phenylobacterium sp.]|uniref:TIGR01244 family sulfur transferase n=1 Tax=Phenylobacterium sp. TaxID=1871053 RepID=UPI002C300DB7|nr:TIGR01244 family sulfur transferase [Phenylobacterium sp.]HSV04079.1 TIGR01244 family sulfur transferase [Phenylobacterium sp.]